MAAIVYFSRAEENLINGTHQLLTKGNTQIVAEKIALKVNGQIYGVETIDPYPSRYPEAVAKAKLEKEKSISPRIQAISSGILTESIIFLGYPNWWGCYPQAVESFLATTSTTKKIIYPFCTHEGSSFGHSLDQLRKACPEAMIKTGLAIRGSRVSKADQTIDNWLKYVYFQ